MPPAKIHDRRRWGFGQVDEEVVKVHGPQIGAIGIAIYTALATYAHGKDECDPSIGTIAEHLDVTKPTVRKYLNKLRAAGLVDWPDPPERIKGTPGDPRLYRLLPVDKADPLKVNARYYRQLAAQTPHQNVGNDVDYPQGVGNDVDHGGQSPLPPQETTLTTPGQTAIPPVVNDVDPNKRSGERVLDRRRRESDAPEDRVQAVRKVLAEMNMFRSQIEKCLRGRPDLTVEELTTYAPKFLAAKKREGKFKPIVFLVELFENGGSLIPATREDDSPAAAAETQADEIRRRALERNRRSDPTYPGDR